MIKIYIENPDHEYQIDSKKLRFVNYCYAHGKLQDMAGFDLISELKADHFDGRKNLNGEECVAVLPDGTEMPALFFRWKSVLKCKTSVRRRLSSPLIAIITKGLLVAKDDNRAIKFAQDRFNERAKWL